MREKSIKKFSRYFLLLFCLLIFSACSIQTNTENLQGGSSVFVSGDNGNTWKDASGIATIGQKDERISSSIDVLSFYSDPSDNLAVYAATNRGLFYTFNLSNGWNRATSLPSEYIRSVAVSPDNKCFIYVAVANSLYFSKDCNRTFYPVYHDNQKSATVNSVVIDHYNSNNIYLGTSRGEVVKSIDGGNSWRTIHRFDEPIAKIISSPKDSRLIFVATNKSKLYSFLSNTNTDPSNSADLDNNFKVSDFKDLNSVLSGLGIGSSFKDFVVSSSDGALLLASDKMILRSIDNGITWEGLNLIQPDGQVSVNSLAVNPQNSKEIYYVTDTTFFRSFDGGVSWTTKRMPSPRGGSALLVDFRNNRNIYLGTYKASAK